METTRDPDAQLLQRWRDGDRNAGEELFHRYYPPVERFFLNKVTADVADLVQETFHRCIRNRERVRQFRPYLFQIARFTLYEYLRERYQRGTELDFETISISALTSSPTSLIIHQQEERLLLEGLRNIPLRDQILLELHYWEQMSPREIHEALETPYNTIRTQLQRARQRLNETLKKVANSGELLHSTISRLDDWARRIRVQLPDNDDE